jgi:hypothetical protein
MVLGTSGAVQDRPQPSPWRCTGRRHSVRDGGSLPPVSPNKVAPGRDTPATPLRRRREAGPAIAVAASRLVGATVAMVWLEKGRSK